MDRKEIFEWVLETYGTEPDYPWKDCNAVLRHKDSGKWYGVILEVSETKLGITGSRIVDVINVKCDPFLIGTLRQKAGYYPAYHMNKEQWISILLDGSVPAEEIKNLISMSYELTMKKPARKKNQIRKGKESDIEAIMRIWLQTNISAHTFIPASYWKNNFQGVKEAILSAEIYVYEEGNQIVGFIGVTGNYIAGLFVEKKHQGKGIGSRLLKYLKKIKTELALNVYVQNHSAVSFYIKHGFCVKEEALDGEVNQNEYYMEWKQ